MYDCVDITRPISYHTRSLSWELPTPGHHKYLTRILQKLEGELAEESQQSKLGIIRKLVGDISGSSDVSGVLEELYRVDGFDRFALGLMWVRSSQRSSLNCEREDLMEYDVHTLSSCLGVTISGSLSPPDNLGHPSGGSVRSLSEQMYRFGRFITSMKRRLTVGGKFQGFEEDLLFRFMDEVSALQQQAVREGKRDVERFCKAFSRFLEFVISDHLMNDPRVLSLMETANVTVQTISASSGAERGDSLDRTIDLLENREVFLQS